ncbi:MAG: cytochrome-c oxidase, cbb3-type subunit III [Rhodanobacteraceae bacterium]
MLPDGTTGHVWADGVLRESVRRLPLWWVVVSASAFLIGFTYLALYPGFGSFKGLLGWTAHEELSADTEANQSKLVSITQQLAQKPIEELAADPLAMQVGQRLFIDNCAGCHGREAHGNQRLGAPNLADGDSLYGADAESIMTSILDGRHGAMPPLAGSFNQQGLDDVANYVLSLSGAPHSPARAAAGKSLFALCAACHGADGKGNRAIGAPDLTDAIWLYGADVDSINVTIRYGRAGVMPAWRARHADPEARLIGAWVYAQSHPKP